MSTDLYIRRFEAALADTWITPSLQAELDHAGAANTPAMSSEEFRREMLAEFSTALDRERQRNPNVAFSTIASMTIGAFARRFSPEPDADEESVLTESAQMELRTMLDGIMTRVLDARFKDPQADETGEQKNEQVIPFNREKRR